MLTWRLFLVNLSVVMIVVFTIRYFEAGTDVSAAWPNIIFMFIWLYLLASHTVELYKRVKKDWHGSQKV